jgi:hypothetical protein
MYTYIYIYTYIYMYTYVYVYTHEDAVLNLIPNET